MAVLSWGKPKIEFVKLVDGAIPSTPTWTEVDTPVENTTKLTPTKGEKKEAKEEGGAVVASKTLKNSYLFEFELFNKKGKEKPIVDADGVVLDEYAWRLTPEDVTAEGFIIEKASVSVEDTYDTDTGTKWKYSIDALKPTSGNLVKPYTQA